MWRRVATAFAAVGIAGPLLTGCATEMRDPVPATLAETAQPEGVANVRFWGDELPPQAGALIEQARRQMIAANPSLLSSSAQPEISYLAISGGGSDGAYGAGLLTGWTKSGTRPQFQIVTGVSTGALSAPFAFLGPRHDRHLEEMYTRYATDDLLSKTLLAGILGGAAITDTAKLRAVIADYVDVKLLREIAAEHRKGRRLLIGTTNLDAERPVIWDMGAIASSGKPAALELFRDVLMASAAIPGVFPPVLIDVSAGGRRHEELHVDGGVTGQVFFLPVELMTEVRTSAHRKAFVNARRHLYVIRNSKLTPERKVVAASAIAISGRSLGTLIKNQGIGDIHRVYESAIAGRMQFSLAYVPPDFQHSSAETFDRQYMKALFDLGHEQGRRGYPWLKQPPGLITR
jgi:predicted acylesterase/phospholipase RssA